VAAICEKTTLATGFGVVIPLMQDCIDYCLTPKKHRSREELAHKLTASGAGAGATVGTFAGKAMAVKAVVGTGTLVASGTALVIPAVAVLLATSASCNLFESGEGHCMKRKRKFLIAEF